jgi:hypothetical protein
MECLEKDLEACLLYLQFPPAHQLRIRTTNGLERKKLLVTALVIQEEGRH